MAAVIIAIIVLIAAGIVVGVAALRKGRGTTGSLSSRTVKADRRARKVRQLPQALTGKDIERLAKEARRQGKAGQDVELVDEAYETAVYITPDADTIGVTRRQFLNRSVVGMMAFGLSGFGASMLAFLWPSFSSGFGSRINLGAASDVRQQIRDNNGFFYVPEGRMWLVEYPEGSLEKARATYSVQELDGMEAGFVALFQKCPHLGCRVPECLSSQWFECPCHGSRYNRVGEKRGGPAPRGMDRFPVTVSNRGELVVDTGTIIQGPPIGTNTTGQEAEGPNCIGQSSEA